MPSFLHLLIAFECFFVGRGGGEVLRRLLGSDLSAIHITVILFLHFVIDKQIIYAYTVQK